MKFGDTPLSKAQGAILAHSSRRGGRTFKKGSVLQSGDLKSLIEYCVLLIDDYDLRKKIGKNGKEFIYKNYSNEKMVDGFSTVFQSLL